MDLPPDSALRQPLEHLTAEGLMPGVSSHTFAPRDGMSRGAFLEQVLRLLGLSGWKAGTAHFADGTMDSPYYSALMTARSAGLIDGGVDNRFYPERFLSGEEAQELLSQALAWAGLEDRRFSFGPGDLDYLPGPYASRADLALALYAAAECLPLSQEFLGEITWEDQALDWPARTLEEGDCWAALDHLLAAFPDQFSPGLPETEVPASAAEDQVFRTALVLREGTEAVDAFFHSGTLYVNLEQAAALLPEGLAIRREGP